MKIKGTQKLSLTNIGIETKNNFYTYVCKSYKHDHISRLPKHRDDNRTSADYWNPATVYQLRRKLINE